jgi:glycosyltransferase involved in cell wall biosynthesis
MDRRRVERPSAAVAEKGNVSICPDLHRGRRQSWRSFNDRGIKETRLSPLIDQIRPLEALFKLYFGGWPATVESVRSVKRYENFGFSAIGPNFPFRKKGDALFILGSGPTINDISEAEWDHIRECGSIAFNNFITHPFVPDIYILQGNRNQTNEDQFLECYERRRPQYGSVTYIARGDQVNNFSFHEKQAAARIMQLESDRLYFAPELFVYSRTKINPVRIIQFLIEQDLLKHGRMSSLLPKLCASVPMLHVLAALLGYRKVVFCGIDMFDNTHFYDAKYGIDVVSRFEVKKPKVEVHPHADPRAREFSIKRILVDQAREMHRHWGVETYCMSPRSLLYPTLPLYERPSLRIASPAVIAKRDERPLRIAMLTSSFFPTVGGMELQLHNLATRLTERGHDVTVFAPRSRARMNPAPKYALQGFAPNLSQQPYLSKPRRVALGHLDTSLSRLFRAEHIAKPFDVISSHSAYLVSCLAVALRELYDVPVVTRCHGMDINRVPALQYGWRLDPIKDRLITAALKESDRCVAISSDVAAEMAEIVSQDRIVTIHNGVDTDTFTPGPSRLLHERCNLPPDAVIGLTVGRNVPKKRFDLAVLALAQLASSHPEFHLAFVGAGCEPLQELAQKHGVGHRVHILGQVGAAEMPDYFRAADVFVFPSVLETFGAVTAEAMASGLPVVAFDAPGTRDQVVDGVTGILVRDQTAESLAEALAELLSSPERRAALATQARARAVESFSWPRVVHAYERVYRELADQPYTSRMTPLGDVTPDIEAFDRGYAKLTRHAPHFVKAVEDKVRLIVRDAAKALIRPE